MRRLISRPERAGLASLVILCLASIIAFLPAYRDIYRIISWDPDRGYVLLAPLIALYLFWIRRTRLQLVRVSPSYVGLILIISGAVAARIGYHYDVLVAWHGGAILVLIGGMVAVYGVSLIRYFGPALLALFLFVPIPGGIRQAVALPLQYFATELTTVLLHVLGVSAVQRGTMIEINGVGVAVGEACNGMRLLLPLSLLIYCFVFSLPLKAKARVILILISLPVAIFCNVFRLAPTALAYGYAPDWAAEIHDVTGFLMIPVALFGFLAATNLLRWLDMPMTRWRLATA